MIPDEYWVHNTHEPKKSLADEIGKVVKISMIVLTIISTILSILNSKGGRK